MSKSILICQKSRTKTKLQRAHAKSQEDLAATTNKNAALCYLNNRGYKRIPTQNVLNIRCDMAQNTVQCSSAAK